MTKASDTTRRAFLGSTVLATASLPFATGAKAAPPKAADDFGFEIARSDEEWLEYLDPEDEKNARYLFQILRKGGTEWPKDSELWDDYRAGEFYCRGCDLHVYSSEWRAEIDKGWVFFTHAVANAILMDVDKAADYSRSMSHKRTLIEVHCRRCGSHMGHLLNVGNQLVHCVNGASLQFDPATA